MSSQLCYLYARIRLYCVHVSHTGELPIQLGALLFTDRTKSSADLQLVTLDNQDFAI